MICTSNEIELPINTPARKIASTIETATVRAEGIRQKALGGKIRSMEIASRHARSANIYLADYSTRHQLLPSIEQINPHASDGTSNRNRPSCRCVISDTVLHTVVSVGPYSL